MGGKIGNNFLTFFNTVIITRYLGPEFYGKYTFIIAIVSMVVIFWNFGLGVLLTRDVSRDPEKIESYIDGVFTIKSAMALIAISVLMFVIYNLDYDQNIVKCVLLFSIATYFTSISAIFESVFSAFRRMEFSSLLSFLRPIFLFIALSIIVKMSWGLKGIFYGQLTASFLVLIVSYSIMRKYAKPKISFDLQLIRDLAKKGFPFLLISIVHIILFKIDHIMISAMVGDKELGLYGAAYTILEIIITFFPMLIVMSAYPVLSNLYKNDKQEMSNIFHVLFKNLMLIGIPASCGILYLGKEIIIFTYGKEYLEAGIFLSILGCSIWLYFISLLMAWTLTAMNKQNLVLFLNVILMIMNIVTNIYAIKKYGAIGAAVTTGICTFSGVIALCYILIKEKMKLIKIKELSKIIFSSVVMVLSIFLMKNNFKISNATISLFAIIIISIIVYFGMVYMFKLIRKNEIKFLLK